MMNRIVCLFIIIICLAQHANAFSLDKGDLLTFFCLGTGVGLLYTFDSEIQKFVLDNQNRFLDDISPYLEKLGDGWVDLGICGILYLNGCISKDDDLKETGILGGKAFLISSCLTRGLKQLVGRARPGEGKGSNYFIGSHLSLSGKYESFPSGHATAAFAVATVLAERCDNSWVDTFIYTLATLASLQRVYDNAHWASDVLFGAAIGIITARLVVDNEDISIRHSKGTYILMLTKHF
ncbi:MAG: phosphatase PAP2 family protein [bacterium]|nr:phosphatase PAP2 family protein [bacterium]